MRKRSGNIILFLLDSIAVVVAWSIYYWFRVRSGWLSYATEPDFWVPMFALTVYWIIVYFFFGLYRSWYTQSRFDEFATLFKATTFGVVLLFFAIFFDDRGAGSPLHSRLLILTYWIIPLTVVGAGRMMQHTFQRRLLEA